MRIPATTYPSHCRLDQKTIDKIFGKNYIFTPTKIIAQENRFFCTEFLTDPDQIIKLHILGPANNKNQILLTESDAQKLGIQAPKSFPGRREGATDISIKHKEQIFNIPHSTITMQTHLQICSTDAKHLNLRHNQKISVKFHHNQKILENIPVKIQDHYILDLLIPEDIAQKLEISKHSRAEII